MHGASTLGGPLYVVFLVYVFAIAALAVWVMFDATRPKRASAFDARPATRWAWFVPQAIYFVVFAIETLPWTANAFLGLVLVGISPFVLVTQVVYLLRVAFPTQERLAARELAASTLRNVPAEHDAEESES